MINDTLCFVIFCFVFREGKFNVHFVRPRGRYGR